jgi:putative membrane protein
VGRLLDCWQLVARQTRSEDPSQVDGGGTFLVPGLAPRDLDLTAALLPAARVPECMESVDPGFRRILSLRLLLAWLLLMIPVVLTPDRGAGLLLPMAGILVTALALVHLRWRHWGWQLDGAQLWVRSGLFGRRFEVIELERVQQASLLESPWQRRHGLRTLELILPQGGLTIPYLQEETAARLANRALQAAEGIAPRAVTPARSCATS